MKFSHLTDTIILFDDEFDNFQTKLIGVGHNLHLKLGVQVLGCRSFIFHQSSVLFNLFFKLSIILSEPAKHALMSKLEFLLPLAFVAHVRWR